MFAIFRKPPLDIRSGSLWRSVPRRGNEHKQIRTCIYEIPKRKEVKIMKYTKPQIHVSGEALMSIQRTEKGSYWFGDSIDPSSPVHYLSEAAYEADE
jgi:hypothetical protein